MKLKFLLHSGQLHNIVDNKQPLIYISASEFSAQQTTFYIQVDLTT